MVHKKSFLLIPASWLIIGISTLLRGGYLHLILGMIVILGAVLVSIGLVYDLRKKSSRRI